MNTEVLYEGVSLKTADMVGKLSIPTIVSKQGSRIVYQMNLMFRQITNLFDHMPVKTKKDESLGEIDLAVLRNRYVKADKVEELTQYVTENIDSFILPPISAVTGTMYSFYPYNHAEIIEHMGQQFDLVRYPERIEDVLDEYDGMLQGILMVKEPEFNIEIMDGNHRCATIHRLSTLGKEYKNLRIGVQVFYENDNERQRQAFVDLNTSTPIDKTLLTLFGQRDVLSVAAKETIGPNPAYAIEEFDEKSGHYIGFDMLNDSVNKNSSATLTLNIVKNMLIKFALGETGTKKKFASSYQPGTPEYDELLKEFGLFMHSVFERVAPFSRIKQLGVSSIPSLREEYVSLSGAGLYLIANIGHQARVKDIDLEEIAEDLAKLDWRREIETPLGKEYNGLFRSGILNESGNISNNRSAQNATIERVLKAMNLS